MLPLPDKRKVMVGVKLAIVSREEEEEECYKIRSTVIDKLHVLYCSAGS